MLGKVSSHSRGFDAARKAAKKERRLARTAQQQASGSQDLDDSFAASPLPTPTSTPQATVQEGGLPATELPATAGFSGLGGGASNTESVADSLLAGLGIPTAAHQDTVQTTSSSAARPPARLSHDPATGHTWAVPPWEGSWAIPHADVNPPADSQSESDGDGSHNSSCGGYRFSPPPAPRRQGFGDHEAVWDADRQRADRLPNEMALPPPPRISLAARISPDRPHPSRRYGAELRGLTRRGAGMHWPLPATRRSEVHPLP